MGGNVKREILEPLPNRRNAAVSGVPPAVIELSSSSESSSGSGSESESEMDGNSVISKRPRGSSGVNGGTEKKKKRRKRKRNFEDLGVVLPLGFLAPITPPPDSETPSEARMMAVESTESRRVSLTGQSSKQFWKAGDYEGAPRANWDSSFGILFYFILQDTFALIIVNLIIWVSFLFIVNCNGHCKGLLFYIYNLQVEWIMFGFIQNFCILMQLVINGRSEVNLIPFFSTLMITYVGLIVLFWFTVIS